MGRYVQVILNVLSVVVTGAVLAFSCGVNVYELRHEPAIVQYTMGKRLFEKGDYDGAQYLFNNIARLNIITSYSDTAQFLLAESFYHAKEYILAQSEYARLINSMPGSGLVKESRYKIGMCYYQLSPQPALDQEYTVKAINAFVEYLSEYPLDTLYAEEISSYLVTLYNKLATKLYKNANLYKRMGNPEAALVYYNVVLTEYQDAPVAPDALYEKAECLKEMGRLDEARETYQIFLEQFPDHVLKPDARERLRDIQNTLAEADSTGTT